MKTQNVLIVEHNRASRTVHAAALTGYGYHVAEAPTASKARDYLQAGTKPDVVFFDIRPTEKAGDELIQQIRRDGVKIIIASSQPAASTGADVFLSKPFELADLLASVRHFQG